MAKNPQPPDGERAMDDAGDLDDHRLRALLAILRRSEMRTRILRLVVGERSVKQIAIAVGRSENTVRGHLKVLYQVVGGTRVRLALLGLRALRRIDEDRR